MRRKKSLIGIGAGITIFLCILFLFGMRVSSSLAGETDSPPKRGEAAEPILAEVEKAFELGTIDNLIKIMTDVIDTNIRKRFYQTYVAKREADDNIDHYKDFVKGYGELMDYVERLYLDATRP